jgi:hypothetical protein
MSQQETMSQHPAFNFTTAEEIVDAAAELLSQSDIRPIFERIGVHGDMSEGEDALVRDRLDKYATRRGWSHRDPLVLELALPLARMMAVGSVDSSHTASALEFVEGRLFHRHSEASGIRTTLPTVDEILTVVEDIKRDKKHWDEVVRWAVGDKVDERQHQDDFIRLLHASKRKYGLQSRMIPNDHGLLWMLAKGQFSDLRSPAVREHLKRLKMFVRESDE